MRRDFSYLNVSLVNGFELLEWIRRHSEVPFMPVVVLTLSNQTHDIKQAYAAGANSFLIKPPHIDGLKGLGKMIDEYWSKQKIVVKHASLPFRYPNSPSSEIRALN